MMCRQREESMHWNCNNSRQSFSLKDTYTKAETVSFGLQWTGGLWTAGWVSLFSLNPLLLIHTAFWQPDKCQRLCSHPLCMSLPLIFLLPLLTIFPIPCVAQQGLWASEVLWVPLERGSCPGPQLPRQVQQHRRLGRLSTGWEPLREAAGPLTSTGQLGLFVSGPRSEYSAAVVYSSLQGSL